MIALRRQRLTGKHIAKITAVSAATVGRVLKRAGLNRIKDLDLPEPVRRYERQHPGELFHIDIKKLGRFERVGHRITSDRKGQSNSRGFGWEFVYGASLLDGVIFAFDPGQRGRSNVLALVADL